MKSSLISLVTIVTIELLSRTTFKITNPAPLYLTAVVYAACNEGVRAGLMSAAIALLYALYFLSVPGQLFHYSSDNLQHLIVLFVTTVAIALIAGTRKRRSDDKQLEGDRSIPEASAPAIVQSETLLNALLESAPIGLAFLDRELRFVELNKCLAAINGIPIAQHLGRTVKEILPPELSSAVYEKQYRVIETGEPILNLEQSGETLAAPGQQGYWLTSFYPVYSKNREILGIGVAVADITEFKKAEKALQQSQKRFRVAQELSLDAFTILRSVRDSRRKIVDFEWEYANPKAAEILQHPVKNLIGKRLLDLLPGNQTNSELFESYVRVVETGESHDIEIPYKSEGINGWFRNMAVKLDDGIAISFSDITERKRAEEELHRREQEFKALVENAPDSIFRLDKKFRHLYVNRAAKQTTGMSPEASIGKTPTELGVPEELRSIWEEKYRQVFTTGQELWFEITLPSLKEMRYYQVRIVPEFDRDGSVKSILGISRDVTDYKQAEQALRESEARFRRVLESNTIGMGFWDKNGYCTEANDAFLEIVGYRREDFFSDAFNGQKIAASEYLLLEEQQLQKVLDRGIIVPYEKEYIHKDGSRISALIGGARFEGNSEGGVFFVIDLTKRKRAEEELRESEERLRLSLEAGRMGIWDWNILTGEIKWSDNLESIYGMVPGSCSGTFEAFLKIVHPEDREMVKVAIARAVEERSHYDIEFRIVWSDGSIHWMVGIGKTFCDRTGKAVRIIGVGMDVTDRKQAQLELQQQAEELAQANRIKDEFLAILSHELRSPLNVILGWTQLLRTGKFDRAASDRALETIESNARLQTQLIEDLLDISRIIRGKLSLNISPVNLASTIKASVENMHLAAAAKSIQIQLFLEPNVGYVLGDASRLQQIVWNLLANAIKFTPKGGRVEIRLSVENGNASSAIADSSGESPMTPDALPMTQYAQISISDTGIGIKADFLPYIFDYFRQADSSITRKYEGLGLGLASVRHLVELHGGTIRAESPGEDRGSTFTVKLPLGKREQANGGRDGTSTSIGNSQVSLFDPQSLILSGLQILIVDDEVDSREFLSAVLEQYGAVAIAVASTFEALSAFKQLNPDLLLIGISKAAEDSYDLIGQIRSMEIAHQWEAIPTAALTAHVKDEERLKALKAGFNQYISKPVDPAEFVEAIARLAKRLTSQPSTQ